MPPHLKLLLKNLTVTQIVKKNLTVAQIAEKLNGCSNPSRLNLGEGVYGYKFNKNEKNIYVVWELNETKISIPLTGKVKITNVLGVVKEVDTDNLIVDVIPIFIERR